MQLPHTVFQLAEINVPTPELAQVSRCSSSGSGRRQQFRWSHLSIPHPLVAGVGSMLCGSRAIMAGRAGSVRVQGAVAGRASVQGAVAGRAYVQGAVAGRAHPTTPNYGCLQLSGILPGAV